jgi:hypothetical protein
MFLYRPLSRSLPLSPALSLSLSYRHSAMHFAIMGSWALLLPWGADDLNNETVARRKDLFLPETTMKALRYELFLDEPQGSQQQQRQKLEQHRERNQRKLHECCSRVRLYSTRRATDSCQVSFS